MAKIRKSYTCALCGRAIKYGGVGNNEKIGGDYDCRLDAMSAVKEHALKSGREQIYGLCVNGLMTHFVKSNGYHFDIWELPIDMQTRMEKIDYE